MKTKAVFVVLLCLLVSSLWPPTAWATPPSRVVPEFDLATKTLSVTISHWTLYASWHHIKTVEINLNGKPYSVSHYTTQPGNTFTYTYQVAATPDDLIEVTATCNLLGSKTARITVPKPSQVGNSI